MESLIIANSSATVGYPVFQSNGVGVGTPTVDSMNSPQSPWKQTHVTLTDDSTNANSSVPVPSQRKNRIKRTPGETTPTGNGGSSFDDRTGNGVNGHPAFTGSRQVSQVSQLSGTGSSDIDSNFKNATDGNKAYINHVVNELINTERIYVKDLGDVVYGYLKNFAQITNNRMSKVDCTFLFGNIRAIHRFNRRFLAHLSDCRDDPVGVAKCFVDQFDGFIIYTDYCTNYQMSVEIWTRMMKDEMLPAMLHRQQVKLQHSLPLSAYLFKPVQRILKYHLLLQNLANNYDANEPGRDVIVDALDHMVDIARHINEVKRQHERTEELQSALALGWSKGVQKIGFGQLIMEDDFHVSGMWGDRHVILFAKALVIAKKLKDGNLHAKVVIRMSSVSLVENIAREPLQFSVADFNKMKQSFTLQARNLELKHRWCQEIKKLMIENHPNADKISDRAKQILGVGVEGTDRQRSGSLQAALARHKQSEEMLQSTERLHVRRKSVESITSERNDVLPERRPSVFDQVANSVEDLTSDLQLKPLRKRSSSHGSILNAIKNPLCSGQDTDVIPTTLAVAAAAVTTAEQERGRSTDRHQALTRNDRRSVSLDSFRGNVNEHDVSSDETSSFTEVVNSSEDRNTGAAVIFALGVLESAFADEDTSSSSSGDDDAGPDDVDASTPWNGSTGMPRLRGFKKPTRTGDQSGLRTIRRASGMMVRTNMSSDGTTSKDSPGRSSRQDDPAESAGGGYESSNSDRPERRHDVSSRTGSDVTDQFEASHQTDNNVVVATDSSGRDDVIVAGSGGMTNGDTSRWHDSDGGRVIATNNIGIKKQNAFRHAAPSVTNSTTTTHNADKVDVRSVSGDEIVTPSSARETPLIKQLSKENDDQKAFTFDDHDIEDEESNGAPGELYAGWPQNYVFRLARAYSYRAKRLKGAPSSSGSATRRRPLPQTLEPIAASPSPATTPAQSRSFSVGSVRDTVSSVADVDERATVSAAAAAAAAAAACEPKAAAAAAGGAAVERSERNRSVSLSECHQSSDDETFVRLNVRDAIRRLNSNSANKSLPVELFYPKNELAIASARKAKPEADRKPVQTEAEKRCENVESQSRPQRTESDRSREVRTESQRSLVQARSPEKTVAKREVEPPAPTSPGNARLVRTTGKFVQERMRVFEH